MRNGEHTYWQVQRLLHPGGNLRIAREWTNVSEQCFGWFDTHETWATTSEHGYKSELTGLNALRQIRANAIDRDIPSDNFRLVRVDESRKITPILELDEREVREISGTICTSSMTATRHDVEKIVRETLRLAQRES